MTESRPAARPRRPDHRRALIRALVVGLALPLAGGVSAQGSIPTYDLREELRIQSSETVPGMLLTGVSDVAVLPDGRIITVHAQERMLRVFDSGGRLLRTVGRRGQGPGEFGNPQSVGYVGDTIWVRDLSHRRYLRFNRDFEPIGSVIMPGRGGFYYGLVSGTTSLLAPSADTGVIGVYQDTILLHSIGVPYRVAGHQYAYEQDVGAASGIVTGRTTTLLRRSPLSVRTEVGPLPGGRGAIILESAELWGGRPGQFTIRHARTATGDVSPPVTVSLQARRLTRAAADSIVNASVARLTNARLVAAIRDKARLPEYYPAFSSFSVSADGTIWLSEYGVRDTRLVIDPAGRILMRVRIPAGLAVFAISRTHAWGRLRDADDLPIIVRYRIGSECGPCDS